MLFGAISGSGTADVAAIGSSGKGEVYPNEEVEKVRDRQKQRELRRKQKKEESIDKRNGYGIKDLTAYNAVLQIRTNNKASILHHTNS